ncbi:hypothetical protein V6N11_030958 [Hibiscus sabdariffa]|uniref:F-box domain-containing protein n=1 Tax=Hibiscus sabdariffa TaxID=183260 RepID=A0ABR2NRX3_9ROSI
MLNTTLENLSKEELYKVLKVSKLCRGYSSFDRDAIYDELQRRSTHTRQATSSEEGENNKLVILESLIDAIQGLNLRLKIHERIVQNITTKQNVTQQVHARSNDEEEIENILFVSNEEPIFTTQDDHLTTNTYEGIPRSKDENEIPCDVKKNDSNDPNEKELVKHIVVGDSTQENQKLKCEEMLGLFWEHPPALDLEDVGKRMQFLRDRICAMAECRRVLIREPKLLLIRAASIIRERPRGNN